MKASAIAIAFLLSGTAIAQTTTETGTNVSTDTDVSVQADTEVNADTSTQTHSNMNMGTSTQTDSNMNMGTSTQSSVTSTTTATMTPASGQIVQAGNNSPERDARGIAVISAPAMVPAGWNGVSGTAVGGPLVDPATGQTVTAETEYPACSRTVTDNCLQTYERGRSR